MPAGFQAFDAAGVLQTEITDRVYRMLTIADIPTTNSGSIAVVGLDGGTPVVGAINATQGKEKPTLAVVGSNLTWDYGSIPSGNRDAALRVSVAVY